MKKGGSINGKRKRQQLTVHHRKPRSRGGSNEPSNISHVKHNLHMHWHGLFDNHSPEEICEIINLVWIDPDYKFVCIKKS